MERLLSVGCGRKDQTTLAVMEVSADRQGAEKVEHGVSDASGHCLDFCVDWRGGRGKGESNLALLGGGTHRGALWSRSNPGLMNRSGEGYSLHGRMSLSVWV